MIDTELAKRKPDGGLTEWIEILEAGENESDAELLCLLLELRRFRQDKQALIEQLEAAQREQDELTHKDYLTWHAAACKFRQRAEAAEAELKRRDEPEPVAWVAGEDEIREFHAGREVCVMRDCDDRDLEYLALYAAAPAAVMPPDAEHVASVLEMIGSFDAKDIDGDSVDLRFEVDGLDTGSDASVTEYTSRGAMIIRKLIAGVK